MVAETEGIRTTAPVRWQSYTGFCAVHWEACGEAGAKGYYRSPDPRLMLFFNDVSHRIVLSEKQAEPTARWRPMLRALFVPAGMPMWTEFRDAHRFSHLDLHLSRDWLLERLSPMVGAAVAEDALRRPVEVQDVGALAVLATTLAQEIAAATRGRHFAESLAVAMVAGLIDAPEEEAVEGALLRRRRPAALLRRRRRDAAWSKPRAKTTKTGSWGKVNLTALWKLLAWRATSTSCATYSYKSVDYDNP